jgi:hypothetical protein
MRRSTFRTWLVALLALAVLAPIGAQAPATVALSDFVVNSANPSFAYLGKGFAEIALFLPSESLYQFPQVPMISLSPSMTSAKTLPSILAMRSPILSTDNVRIWLIFIHDCLGRL